MTSGAVYYLTHPEAVIYVVASALLVPVLVFEVLAMVVVVVEAGRATVETLWRWRRRAIDGDDLAARVREALAAGKAHEAGAALAAAFEGTMAASLPGLLGDLAVLDRVKAAKALDELELAVRKRLDRTRMLVRIGPMLGLMGTLIPISPALVALAQGDVQTLSDNLVIAFSTTVVGLFVGGVAYVVSLSRERSYDKDVSDVEYLLERLGLS